MARKITFGAYLRACRIKAGYGLLAFAEEIGMRPSNLSNVEHSRIPPPQDPDVLETMARALRLSEAGRRRLADLAVAHKTALPPDVARFAARHRAIPVLLRTVKDRRLTAKEVKEVAAFIERRYRKRAR